MGDELGITLELEEGLGLGLGDEDGALVATTVDADVEESVDIGAIIAIGVVDGRGVLGPTEELGAGAWVTGKAFA